MVKVRGRLESDPAVAGSLSVLYSVRVKVCVEGRDEARARVRVRVRVSKSFE